MIEENIDIAVRLRQAGQEAITGNAADPEVIAAGNLSRARCLLVAIPDAFEGGQVVAQARTFSADLPIIARAHSEDEIGHLEKHGATLVVMGERRNRQGDGRQSADGPAHGRWQNFTRPPGFSIVACVMPALMGLEELVDMASVDALSIGILLGSLLALAGILSSLVALRFGAPLLLVFLLVGMLAGEAGPGGIKFDDVGSPTSSARSRSR